MPFCASCGEITAKARACAKCGSAATTSPVTGDLAAAPNSTPDMHMNGLRLDDDTEFDLAVAARGMQPKSRGAPERLVRDLAKNLEKSEWQYSSGEDTFGPVGIAMLRDLFTTGMIEPDACVWTEAMGEGKDWLLLSDPKNAALLTLLRGPTAAVDRAPKDCAPCADVCGGCGAGLTEECSDVFGALGKLWHPDCFKCAGCEKAFADESFTPHDGKVLKYALFGLTNRRPGMVSL